MGTHAARDTLELKADRVRRPANQIVRGAVPERQENVAVLDDKGAAMSVASVAPGVGVLILASFVTLRWAQVEPGLGSVEEVVELRPRLGGDEILGVVFFGHRERRDPSDVLFQRNPRSQAVGTVGQRGEENQLRVGKPSAKLPKDRPNLVLQRLLVFGP